MIKQKINITEQFNACVRDLGGQVLDDVFKGPNFENADYWFPQPGVFAELKCLEVDLMTDLAFRAFITKLHGSWVQRGMISPLPSHVQVWKLQLQNLPTECRVEFMNGVRRKMERVLRKANRQIRQTKNHFGCLDAKGILLLANDGNHLLHPELMLRVLFNLTKEGAFSDIQSFVYFTATVEAHSPSLGKNTAFWIEGAFEGREAAPEDFRLSLSAAWRKRYQEASSKRIEFHEGHQTLIHELRLQSPVDVLWTIPDQGTSMV